MHVTDHFDSSDSEKEEKPSNMSMEDVTRLFHTMSKESGVKNTYQVFRSQAF